MKILNFTKKNKIVGFTILAYLVVLVISPEIVKNALGNTVYYLLEMLEVLPVIFIFTVFIDAWVPTQTIIKGLGKGSGIKGGVAALALGSLSAGPIYAAFPIAKMLMKKGASVTNIVIILSAWAVVKVPMLANEAKFLGPEFMGLRWVLTVAAIFAMAYITSLIVRKKDLPDTAADESKLEIKEEFCVGCGLCEKTQPEYFQMEDGIAKVKKIPEDGQDAKELRAIAEKCPSNAIAYVDRVG